MEFNNKLKVWKYSEAGLPTKFGNFRVLVFRNNQDDKEHLAIIKGNVENTNEVPLRIHSECLTSEVLGSLKCDCNEQLETALQFIGDNGLGVVLYMRQEGRGIGLGNKIRAYALQEAGYDTVEANHLLGFPDDLRDYSIAAEMIRFLKINSIKLLTNNPGKITGLQTAGIEISERIPIQVKHNHINKAYLMTKAAKSGHLLNFPDLEKEIKPAKSLAS